MRAGRLRSSPTIAASSALSPPGPRSFPTSPKSPQTHLTPFQHPRPAMLHAKPSPLVSRKATPPNPLSHPSDAHPPKRQRVLTSKAAEWAATETGSASPLLTHFNASKPMAFPATKGNTETISVRQLVSYMPSTAETPSFLRCNACLQPVSSLLVARSACRDG